MADVATSAVSGTLTGGVLGGALSAGSALLGNWLSSNAAEKQKKILDNQLSDNQNWYNKRYNEDYLQRSDSQRAMNYARQSAKDITKRASGQAAVTGGTDAATALAKESATKGISDTASNIAANASKYKQGIENQYLNNKTNIENQQGALEGKRATNIMGAINNAGQVGSNIISGATSGLYDKYKQKQSSTATGNEDTLTDTI